MINISVKSCHVAAAYDWCAQHLGNLAVGPVVDQTMLGNQMRRKFYLDFNLEQSGWHLAGNVFYFKDEGWATAFKLLWS